MLQTVFLILGISILPISLIKFGFISRQYRLVLLFTVLLVALGYATITNPSIFNLYLPNSDTLETLVWYVLMVILAGGFLVLAKLLLKTRSAKQWYKDLHFQYLFIPISFAQQFLFQGVILTGLLEYFTPLVAIVSTALIFGYLHTIYPRPMMSFTIGTLGGLMFATVFFWYPDLLLSSIAHSILNFLAVYLGFFSLTDSKQRPLPAESLAI
jgi:membrane protease YdiL (CAAX protease family)